MLSIPGALGLYLFSLAAMLSGGAILGSYGLPGIAASEWLCVALPTVLVIAAFPGRPVETLRLRLPAAGRGARALAAGLLVGASAWIVLAYGVLPLQELIAPTPRALEEALQRVAVPGDQLLGTLFAVALTPAICEELLCRGALLPSLRSRLDPWAAILVTALLFAALHLSPYRLLPTFLLGIAFGALAQLTGSTVPSMVAHALNNGAVVVLSSDAGAAPRLLLEKNRAVATVSAAVVLAAGLLAARRRRSSPVDH